MPQPQAALADGHLATAVAQPGTERAIIEITSVGHTICHIGELIFPGVLLTVKDEFQLEPHLATALGLLGYVLMGVGAIPVGLWADTWGPRRVMFWYFLLMAAAGLAVACAP